MRVASAFTDQAAGLRRVARRRPVRVVAVTSGKGGVGKTNVSVNLAIALAKQGDAVMLLDADLGLGNADVLLGLQPRLNLSHVLDGKCTLDEIIVEGPAGVRLVPASSGVRRMTNLNALEHAGVVRAFSELAVPIDTLIVDTAAGTSDTVTSFVNACQEIIVVVCDEPASITDAYALIKVISRDFSRARFRILVNMARSAAEGRDLYLKLVRVTDRFLSVGLDFLGVIPFGDAVHRAVQQQRAVVQVFPRSQAALAFRKIAIATGRWPRPDEAHGQLEFFVERLVQPLPGLVEASLWLESPLMRVAGVARPTGPHWLSNMHRWSSASPIT